MFREALVSFCLLFYCTYIRRVRDRLETISFAALARLRVLIISLVFTAAVLWNALFYI